MSSYIPSRHFLFCLLLLLFSGCDLDDDDDFVILDDAEVATTNRPQWHFMATQLYNASLWLMCLK